MLTRVPQRVRDERGMSLIEILVVTFMFIIVLLAALTPFEVLQNVDRKAQSQNQTQQNARQTVSAIAFNLRNLAGQSQLVERADAYDLVFETVDRNPKPPGSQNARNIMRVRYCLATNGGSASAGNGWIWEQTQRWTTAAVPTSMPVASSCPDVLWGGSSRRVVTGRITNRIAGQNRPLFTYYPTGATLTQITSIRMDLFTDDNLADKVKETRHTSGVLLRNQNGAPTASVATASAGVRAVRLDATASDPENLPLTYRWCDLSANSVCDDATRIGTGQSYTHTFAAAVATGSSRNMRLVVTDAGGLEVIVNFTVTVPAA
jgi:type II secretory pathway pseudopilin PulG